MSHFLGNTPGVGVIGRPHAAVSVKVKGKNLILDIVDGHSSVKLTKADTRWAKLPDCYKVTTPEGTVIKPSGTFYVSAETIDPCHLVTDLPKDTRLL